MTTLVTSHLAIRSGSTTTITAATENMPLSVARKEGNMFSLTIPWGIINFVLFSAWDKLQADHSRKLAKFARRRIRRRIHRGGRVIVKPANLCGLRRRVARSPLFFKRIDYSWSAGAMGNGKTPAPSDLDVFAARLVAAAKASKLEPVTVFEEQKFLENLRVQPLEEGVRSSRILGVNLMDEIMTFFKYKLEEEVANADDKLSFQKKFWKPSLNRTALELPSEMNCQTIEHFDAVATKCSIEGGLAIKTARSSSMISVWYRSYMLPLARLVNASSVDLIDIQSYFFSCMNAAVEAGFCVGEGVDLDIIKYPVNAGNGRKARGFAKYHLVAYNSALPLGKSACGKYDVYLADAGSDGTTNFAWSSDKKDDLQGQSRSLLLGGKDKDEENNSYGAWVDMHDNKDAGGILKGMHCGDEVRLLKDECRLVKREMYTQEEWDSLEFEDRLPMVVDVNMPKGKGKNIEAVKQSKVSEVHGLGFSMDDYYCWSWFIRVLKDGFDHNQTLATSFQECVFWQGVEEANVDPKQLHDELLTIIQGEEDPYIKEVLEGVAGKLDKDMSMFSLKGVGIPYRAIKESINSKLMRAASAGLFTTKRVYKERGNIRCPLHFVVVGNQVETSWEDKKLRKKEFLDNVAMRDADRERIWDWEMTMEERNEVTDPTMLEYAHQRTPTLSPLSLTVSLGMKHADLLIFTQAIREGKESWTPVTGVTRSVDGDVRSILRLHNKTKNVKQHSGEVEEDFESMKARLVEFGIAMKHANLDACFMCNPLEGRDRNADHDGDDTACDSSLYWVRLYKKLEARWDRMPRFVNELPKDAKMSWADPQLEQVLVPGGESEKNVKAMSILEMLPSLEHCSVERIRGILNVSLVETQGPTGLGSNVAADLFARVRWEEQEDGSLKPSNDTEKVFKLWVFYCFLVQIFIDWTKRAYKLPLLSLWEKLVEAILEKGGDGLDWDAMVEAVGNNGWADKDSEVPEVGQGVLMLAENWCYSPSIIYGWAQKMIDNKASLCMWKGGREGNWYASQEEIVEDLRTMNPDSRFYNVNMATHGQGGWRNSFGDVSNYVRGISRTIGEAGKDRAPERIHNLSKRVDYAFRHIQSVTLEAGEDGNLGKLGDVYRGNLFLGGLGFGKDGIEDLGFKKKAKNLSLEADYDLLEVIIAISIGDNKIRPIPAIQIVLSWYSALNNLEEWEMKVIARGKLWAQGMSLRITNAKEEGDGFLLPKDVSTLGTYRFFGKNRHNKIPLLCGAIEEELVGNGKASVMFRAAKDLLEQATSLRFGLQVSFGGLEEQFKEEIFEAAKVGLKDMMKLLKVVSLVGLWEDKAGIVKLKKNSGFSYVSEHLAPIVSRKVDAGYRPKGVQQSGDNANYHSGKFHLPLLSCTDPIFLAFKYLEYGDPFLPPARISKGMAFVNYYLSQSDRMLVKSRTLLGGAGWINRDLYSRFMNSFHEGNINVYGLNNAFKALCGTRFAGEGRVDENGNPYLTRRLMNTNFISNDNDTLSYQRNEVAFLESCFMAGAIPLPANLSVVNPNYDGWPPEKYFILKVLLQYSIFAAGNCSYTNEEECKVYASKLKEVFMDKVRKFSLDLGDNAYQKLYPYTGLTIFNKDSDKERVKERSKVLKKKQELAALVNAYKALGL